MHRLLQNNGSIVLEFLLVMPIYFALIGGTFWIGDLLLNRDNLLISDRLATGHWGGRHDWDNDKRKQNDDTMRSRLNFRLFDIMNQSPGNSPIVTNVVQSRVLQDTNYSWSQTVGSKTSLWAPQPSWTRGWLHGNDTAWRKTIQGTASVLVTNVTSMLQQLPTDIIGMNARISEYNFLNVSLMRTKKGEDGYRSWKPASLCHEDGIPVINAVWYTKVYAEEYPLHSLDKLKQEMLPENTDSEADYGENGQSDYARFPTYVLWGQ